VNFNQPINQYCPHSFIDIILSSHKTIIRSVKPLSIQHVLAAILSKLCNALGIFKIASIHFADLLIELFGSFHPECLESILLFIVAPIHIYIFINGVYLGSWLIFGRNRD
jgi:hypothetical protein